MKSICNVEKICYTLKVDFFDLQIMETNTKNKEEEQQLLTDEYQDKLAWGIYNGIMDYFYNL